MWEYKVTEVEELSTKVLRRVHRFHGPDEAEAYKKGCLVLVSGLPFDVRNRWRSSLRMGSCYPKTY